MPNEAKSPNHGGAGGRVSHGGSRISPGKGNLPVARADCRTHESSERGGHLDRYQSAACGYRGTAAGGRRSPPVESRGHTIASGESGVEGTSGDDRQADNGS